MTLDLKTLQQRVQSVLGDVAHPRVGAALALSEETGEVCDLVLKKECYGKVVSSEALEGELADVLVCVAELANAYGVDLAAACDRKLNDLSQRVPAWKADFGPSLEAARKRMD
jgi:NTP pyrophosphatase (non-canonical NTP hydrolase)